MPVSMHFECVGSTGAMIRTAPGGEHGGEHVKVKSREDSGEPESRERLAEK